MTTEPAPSPQPTPQPTPEPTPEPTPAPSTTLFNKSVLVGTLDPDTYDRDSQYPTWDDTDGDCYSNRHEILIAQHIDDDDSHPLRFREDNECLVTSGKWYDPYDDVYYYSPENSAIQIDHVVALSEAHNSGAYEFTSTEKRTFANTGNKVSGTLPETSHGFLAVGAASNQSKWAYDPTEWMPSNTDYHCTYLKKWVEVKVINELYFDQEEYDFIKNEEANCDDSPLPELPPNTENTYIVTVDATGNYYYIDGQENKDLTLQRGHTYEFDISSFSGHPFRISDMNDGTHSGGDTYTNGITIGNGKLIWDVPNDLVNDTMYYFCTIHSGMAGTGKLNIVN